MTEPTAERYQVAQRVMGREVCHFVYERGSRFELTILVTDRRNRMVPGPLMFVHEDHARAFAAALNAGEAWLRERAKEGKGGG